MVWACVAAKRTGSLLFIDEVTVDKNSRMSSLMFETILSAQIEPNVSKLLGQCFTEQLDNDLNQAL